MGIRESFEQHPQGEDLNIHDIVIEKDEKPEPLPFDPEIEISNSNWQEMKSKLDSYRSQGEWWDFSSQAMNMKILFPERTKELDLNEPSWQGMKTHLDLYRSQGNWRDFSWQVMKMKILAAHKVEITDEGLDITMRKPEPFRPEKKTPRPERRQF